MNEPGASAQLTCPSCGASWPPGMRFCGACGSALGQAAPEPDIEERKVVTVLVADLTASTEMAARLDPEDLRRILQPFFQAMTEEIERFGGTVEKYIGDAIVAVFGVPAAHEDDPERAVRSAMAMQRRLERLNHQLRDQVGEELAMRVGVNTGEVVTATGLDREALVTGEPVNVASRFEALAPPGGVVAGDRTYRDTRHAIRYRPLGEVQVKGIDRPLPAWEVTGVEEQPAGHPGRVGLAPMVGRDEELALLDILLARVVREGRAGLATLVGPAGIGKTRLSQEFVERAGRRGPVRVVRGRCLAYGEGLTYWPLADILKADAAILDSDAPDATLHKAEAAIAPRFRTAEEASAHIRVLLASIGVPVSPDPLAGAEPAAAREVIARSWRAYLESMAGEEAVVAVIEDLHWGDDSLLDLLENVAARGSKPVLLVCTTRPDLTERRPTWGGGLRSSTTIALTPLTDRDGEHLVRHLLGGLPAPDEALRPILARSEGNPFFAQELLRMITESGVLVRRDSEWVLDRALPDTLPDTVQGVLASRIDMLPAVEKRAMQDAAVVGRTFWQGAVERLGSADPSDALDALVDRGLLWEQGASQIEGERELVFNHVLTQDVAYASIPKSRRRQAHAAALVWVEEVTGGREEEFAEILAHHAEQAGDRDRTARYATLAGHRSRRVFAAREAIRWYDRALAASGHDGAGKVVAEACLARGEARELLGEFDLAEADYRTALETARTDGSVLLEARALGAMAHVMWLQDRFEEGREVLGQALDQARSAGATELLATLLYTAGTLAFGQGRYAEALPLHEEAVRVAIEAGDRAGEALGRHGLCETLYFLGPLDRSLEEGEAADALFRSLGQRPMAYHNLYMVAWVKWFKGRLSEATAQFEESAVGSREVGNRRDEAFALAGLMVKMLLGDLGGALRAGWGSVGIALEIQTPRLELAARGVLAQTLMEAGAVDQAREAFERASALIDQIQTDFSRPRTLTMGGWLALRAGDPAAGNLFERARAMAEGVLLEDLVVGWEEVTAAEDCADAALAREAGERLVRRAAGESPWFESWGRYGLALADVLEERWQPALEHSRQVLEQTAQSGDRMLQWRAAATAWKAFAAAGRHSEAEAERARAASVLEEISASLDDEALRASFLARAPVAEVLAEGTTSRLFSGVPPQDLDELWSAAEARRLAAGDSLFRSGEPGDAVYFVQDGAISLTMAGPSGQVTLARLGPGEFAGEMAVIGDGPRTADATAEAASTVLRVARDDFFRFLGSHPLVAERLLAILSRRLEEDASRMPGQPFEELADQLTQAMQRLARAGGRASPAIEILPVYLAGDSIRWLRPAGSSSLQIETPSSSHPGDAVAAALEEQGLRPRAVHSTSWRSDNGRLVVTYLAVIEPPAAPPAGLRDAIVGRFALARGSATGPPPDIEIGAVTEHALRHFAWLVKDDPVIRDLFASEWGPALAAYTPEPFRSLDDPGGAPSS